MTIAFSSLALLEKLANTILKGYTHTKDHSKENASFTWVRNISWVLRCQCINLLCTKQNQDHGYELMFKNLAEHYLSSFLTMPSLVSFLPSHSLRFLPYISLSISIFTHLCFPLSTRLCFFLSLPPMSSPHITFSLICIPIPFLSHNALDFSLHSPFSRFQTMLIPCCANCSPWCASISMWNRYASSYLFLLSSPYITFSPYLHSYPLP